uniref:Ion_trans domain-containing protein n=1 Tax=Loa loa TaxID=7209 RepID=A0A1I7VZV3_LOALO
MISVLQIAIIWIPTLLAFAFAFHLVMRNSGQEPWEAAELFSQNSTMSQKLLMVLQAITKTSAMMIGEVDADNVLERKEWIPNLLLLAFEISTVILLMNLMISLAVGDVNELRQTAQEKLLTLSDSERIPLESIVVNYDNGEIDKGNDNEHQVNGRNTQELLHNV